MTVYIKNFDNKKKITKKEYLNLVKNNIHYNIGTIYINNMTGTYNISKEKLLNLLNTKFLKLDYLNKNCLCCLSCKENTKDFLHIEKNSVDLLHESKKGSFYIIDINQNKSLILHYYKDTTKTISFKVVVKTTNILDIII